MCNEKTGEFEIIGRALHHETPGRTLTRVQKVGQAGVTEIRTWGAHERVSVKRASAD